MSQKMPQLNMNKRQSMSQASFIRNGIAAPLPKPVLPKKSKQLLQFERILETCLMATLREIGLASTPKKLDMLTKKVD